MVTSSLRTARAPRRLRALVGLLALGSVVGLLSVREDSWVALVTDAGGRAAQLSPDPSPALPEPGPAAGVATGQAAPTPVVEGPPATGVAAATSVPARTRGASPGSTPTGGSPPSSSPSTIDTGLWVGDRDGPLRLLSPEAGWTPLAWSPSSGELAAARGHGVTVFNPGSGSRRPVLSRPGMTALRAAWSPDGRSLAVQLSDPASSRPMLYAVDLATGAATELPLLNLSTSLAYTPNGCLAFADSVDGSTGIALHCPGQARQLVPLAAAALLAGLGSTGFAYAGPAGISVIDLAWRPAPGVTGPTALYGSDLAWDQSTATIIWRGSHNGQTNRVELYASKPGGSTTTVTRCSASPPTVSTGGTLVYADCDRPGRAALQRRSAPTAPLETVASIPYSRAATPLISPSGHWLAVALSPF